MMATGPMDIQGAILAIILGTLAGIVYSLRVLILVERRIARIDLNLESLTKKILEQELEIETEEKKVEGEEEKIESRLFRKQKKPSKKKSKRR
jgi:hypothetical protein